MTTTAARRQAFELMPCRVDDRMRGMADLVELAREFDPYDRAPYITALGATLAPSMLALVFTDRVELLLELAGKVDDALTVGDRRQAEALAAEYGDTLHELAQAWWA